ncbi:MAG: hypothetical protein IPO08_22390 [Xanthomonadales bacterium]|nr:hypothetical protein [Xanthomonadales bacterium]
MTPSTDNFAGTIALILFVVKSLWDIYREKNKPKIDNAQANNTQAQAALSEAQADKIKAEIQRDVLAIAHNENKALIDRVSELENQLSDERKARKDDNEKAMSLIAELQGQLRERDQVVANQNAVILDLQIQITELKRNQAEAKA